MNFGEKLKQLRTEKNLTQPQLAEAIGIEQSYLSKLENDKSVPSAEMFQSIIKTLEMDARDFLADIDQKILHGALRQIPEVANFIQANRKQDVHSIKRWLFASAALCVLGLTLIVAGYLGLIVSNQTVEYVSMGVIRAGEPSDIFERTAFYIWRKKPLEIVSSEEHGRLLVEFNYTRIEEVHRSFPYDKGYRFDEPITQGEHAGGHRRWTRASAGKAVSRMENNLIMFLGVLLSFAGLFGFVLEYRLRKRLI